MKSKRLDKLTEKRNQINAQIQAIKYREQTQKRKDDTRRKILIGSVMLKMVQSGEMPKERLAEKLDKHLTKPNERQLFDLSEKTSQEN